MAGPITAALWYEALATELGIVVAVGNPQFAIKKLNALREELKDAELNCMCVVPSPTNPGREIWLVKRSVSDASERGLRAGESHPEPEGG